MTARTWPANRKLANHTTSLVIAKRRNVPTPNGRTPAQTNASARPPSFIPISDLAS
jgi:hypothetical protein